MRLAILCSGQAGQHCRMLDDVLAAPDCAQLRALASDVLEQEVTTWWRSLDTRQIFANANAQFAIALYQIATWSRVAPLAPRPSVVAGYSLGELIAWHVAGALDAEQTLRLVRLRAALMDRAAARLAAGSGGGCMLLWRGRSSPAMRAARTAALAVHGLVVAIHRPGGDLVLAGPEAAIDTFLADPVLRHADLKRLQVSVPSHTRWLAEAVAPFHDALAASMTRDPELPVVAGIDGAVLRRRTDALSQLPAQIAQPLHWDWCQETLGSLGIDVALELGPGNDLAKLLENGGAGVAARGIEEFGPGGGLRDWLEARE